MQRATLFVATLLVLAVLAMSDGLDTSIDAYDEVYQEILLMKQDELYNSPPGRSLYRSKKVHSRLKFVESARLMGQGYNLIYADPNTVKLGATPSFGSSDPGYTKAQVFRQTWSRIDKSDRFLLPDFVTFEAWKGEKCREVLDHELIPGVKAYQRLLLANTVKSTENGSPTPTNCKTTFLGQNYAGDLDVTLFGRKCREWGGGRGHNYCRNWDGEFKKGPSCIPVDEMTMEICDVPFCTPGLDPRFHGGAFLGPYYQEEEDSEDEKNLEEYLFFESKKSCTDGDLNLDINNDNELEVSALFKMMVCELPSDLTSSNQRSFRDFIDVFGTHVITGAEVGKVWLHRTEIEREILMKEFKDLPMQIKSIEKAYVNGTNVTNQYLVLDLDDMTRPWRKDLSERFLEMNNWDTFTWSSGTDEIPKPTSLTLSSLDIALESRFWRVQCGSGDSRYTECCSQLEQLQTAVRYALDMYPQEVGVLQEVPRLFPENVVAFPVRWPAGLYSLPQANGTCPWNWKRGSVTQGTHLQNSFSPGMSALSTFSFGMIGVIRHKFCSKVHDKGVGPKWPRGTYCINRLGACPDGFTSGFNIWRDAYGISEGRGTTPDGDYGEDKNLMLRYCCRQDGPYNEPILLPTDTPFYLLQIGEHCQLVHGMWSVEHSAYFDGNNWCGLCSVSGMQGGLHPRLEHEWGNKRLTYCHYEPVANQHREWFASYERSK